MLAFNPAKVWSEPLPLPERINQCFKTAITELMLVNRTDRTAVKRLFLKHTDTDKMGVRAVGGATWKNADSAWRDKALDMYFDLLYSKGDSLTVGMKNADNTIINARLADRPEIKPSQGYHVVANVILDNGNSFAVAVLLTKNCKAFDFSQGGWASRFVSATDVDAQMR
jgi:hypothetical protein